ncbi:MaoC family dehydratase [uncultured Megasphaera sp.]|uniref:MaoC family dehydratase n=1 Tax=uncultured Megasphaera sp. TaxID=165188 RepID=UPI0025D5F97F|nr:MaoC family dehydratase [uncultured Megasphaera sp.]
MKIGIKYCGGCNPRYDRSKEVEKLKKKFPQHTFTYDTENTICDFCLLVCGCMTACADTTGIAARQFRPLLTPQQFSLFAKELEDLDQFPLLQKKEIHLGDTACMTRTFTEEDIFQFAALTGDYGKLHTDSTFAALHGFGRPVIHGVLTASLLSSIMGTILPGDGTILMDEQLTFTAPIYPGDTIKASIELTHIEEKNRWYIGEFRGICRKSDGTVVVEGTIHQLMMKTLFSYSNTSNYKEEEN